MASTLSSPPIQEQLNQVITQLDALIRGRKIDLMLLRISASVLLSSSFDVEEDLETLTKQGIKINKMLRSPRFLTKEFKGKVINTSPTLVCAHTFPLNSHR